MKKTIHSCNFQNNIFASCWQNVFCYFVVTQRRITIDETWNVHQIFILSFIIILFTRHKII